MQEIKENAFTIKHHWKTWKFKKTLENLQKKKTPSNTRFSKPYSLNVKMELLAAFFNSLI